MSILSNSVLNDLSTLLIKTLSEIFKSSLVVFQLSRLVELPFIVAGSIQPLLFFFQPSVNPDMATIKKNKNKNAPIVLCTFRKMRKIVTCMYLR